MTGNTVPDPDETGALTAADILAQHEEAHPAPVEETNQDAPDTTEPEPGEPDLHAEETGPTGEEDPTNEGGPVEPQEAATPPQTPGSQHRKRRLGILAAAGAGVLLAGCITGMTLESHAWQARVDDYEHQVASHQAWADRTRQQVAISYEASINALTPVLSAATTALTNTEGQVTDEALRAQLADQIEQATTLKDTQREWATQSVRVDAISRSGPRNGYEPTRTFEVTLGTTPSTYDIDSATSTLTNLTERVLDDQHTWAADRLAESTATARDTLEESEGKVLDPSTRDTLAEAVKKAADTRSEEATTDDLLETNQALLAATQDVRDSQAAWKTEQDRIAAEKAAAAKAAAEKAAAAKSAAASKTAGAKGKSSSSNSKATSTQASGGKGSSNGGGTSSGASSQKISYTLNIVNSGWQTAIDQCAGGWTKMNGLAMVARHAHCGGTGINVGAGKLVKVVGYGYDGIYRSEGVVASVNAGDPVDVVPSGYDLVAMTCRIGDGGSQGIVGLTKVG